MRHLITSALPYINGVKHLGNLVGSMLPADIYARYLRLRGEEILFICATDEHGTPAELAAKEAGLPVADYCREQHAVQKEIGERFGLSWDHFGRSSSPQNHELTQHFAPGSTSRATSRSASPSRCTRRSTTASCPTATSSAPARTAATRTPAATSARTAPGCSIPPTSSSRARPSPGAPTSRCARPSTSSSSSRSWSTRCATWVESHADVWPALTLSIARKWLAEGLQDRGITRDLDWGVPVVDRPGLRGQGLLRVVRRADRVPRRHRRVGRRRRGPRLAELVVRRRRRRVHAVHGQGQRAVPHGVVPGHAHRVARAVDEGPPDQGLQLAHLLRRQVLHERGPRRVHGPGPRHLPRRPLALVPVRQRARVQRLELHVGAVRRRGQQGPGRLVRQPGEPLPHPVGQALRAGGARRWRARRARGAAHRRPRRGGRRLHRADGRQGAAEVRQRAATRLVAGQRLLGAERAVEGREGRPRRGRGDLPHGDQRACASWRCWRRRSSPTSSATVLEALGAGRLDAGPTPSTLDAELRRARARATRWRCRRCCSPRSPTTSWRRWPSASAAPA